MTRSRQLVISALLLLIGLALGLMLYQPLATRFNLNAQGSDPSVFYNIYLGNLSSAQVRECIESGGIWTGNGCAKPKLWTPKDWEFFENCLKKARASGLTQEEYMQCVRETERGRGRK